MSRLRALFACFIALLLPTFSMAAAQEYPSKPIRLIVAFPPGGSNDVVSRLIAAKLSERLGRQVVVENRPGAGGTIGTEIAVGSPPDGYTLLLASVANTVNPWLYKLKYDPVKSLTPVAMLGAGPVVLLVHPSVPARSVQELVALAKKEPGKLNLAHSGFGTLQHLAASMFTSMTGVKFTEVPFKGGGPAMIDVLAGHSQVMLGTVVQSIGHIKSGKLVALGIAAGKRNPALPDVPTISEAGVPGYEIGNFWAIVAPAGTPQAILDKLHKEITAVQSDPQVIKQFDSEGAEVVRMSATELGAFIQKELAKWEKVVKETGMKAE